LLNAYSPLPLAHLPAAMGVKNTHLPKIMFIGGVCGALSGFGMQCYCAIVSYQWNIGGRPNYSWPAFIPITFELTILGAGLAGLLGMFMLNRFPQMYHPISNTPNFERATRDRFFLAVERKDPKYVKEDVESLLRGQSPIRVSEVHR
jgi:hypothetical protein